MFRIVRPVVWGMAAAAALPVGYIIRQHVSWESSPSSKRRMLAHHLTFWSAMTAGLVLLHKKVLRNRAAGPWVRALYGLVAGLLPLLGFEGGGALAMALFPKRPVAVTSGRRYVPGYLRVSA